MTHDDIATELRRLSKQLDSGLKMLRDQSEDLASEENTYRHQIAAAWMEAPKGSVPERKAWVEGQTADQRYKRDLADGLRQAALEAVRSRRTQISALQSLMAADRAEAEFVRTTGGVTA